MSGRDRRKVVKRCPRGHVMQSAAQACLRCAGEPGGVRAEPGSDNDHMHPGSLPGEILEGVAPTRAPAEAVIPTLTGIDGAARGISIHLAPGRTKLGRAPRPEPQVSCQVIQDDCVSHNHLLVETADTAVTLRDLGSKNGTFVNGEPTKVAPLHDGDEIRIGNSVFRFEILRAQQGRDTIVLQAGDEAGARAVRLVGSRLRLGRGPENDLVLDEPGVSCNHALLVRRGGDWVIEDADSRNGTFLNGVRAHGQIVRPGDEVRLGSTATILVVDQVGSPGIMALEIRDKELQCQAASARGGGAHDAAPAWWHERVLMLIPEDGSAPRSFKLDDGDGLSVGRDSDADLVLDDESVSRAHARILRRAGETLVADLESLNGTSLNGVAIVSARLGPGDRVGFGAVVFRCEERLRLSLRRIALLAGLAGLLLAAAAGVAMYAGSRDPGQPLAMEDGLRPGSLGHPPEGIPAAPYSLRIERVANRGHGRAIAWVAIADSAGVPGARLAGSLLVRLDEAPLRNAVVQAFRDRHPGMDWIVVVDPALLTEQGRPAIEEALQGLSIRIRSADAIHVLMAGTKGGVHPWNPGAGLVGVDDGSQPRLFDGLALAVRWAARRGAERGSAILLLTRGSDVASQRKPWEVSALARKNDPPLPITVLEMSGGDAFPGAADLEDLASTTGGALIRLRGTEGLSRAVVHAVQQPLGRYEVSFELPRSFDQRAEHRLGIVLRTSAGEISVEQLFMLSRVAGPPVPPAWPGAVAGTALGLIGIIIFMRRPVCRLIVTGGTEDGCSYALHALPISIGAAHDNDILLEEASVSRSHARLERRGVTIELSDGDSEHGSFVNGERVRRRALVHRDVIQLGPGAEFIFERGLSCRP